MSATDFEVLFGLLCDYSTQDISGKFVWGGVYGNDINFARPPTVWPSISVVACLRPLSRAFGFQTRLVRPDGSALLSADVQYKLDRDLSPQDIVTVAFQLPPVRFTGPGLYSIQLGVREKSPVYSRAINIGVGQYMLRKPAEISASMTIDAEI